MRFEFILPSPPREGCCDEYYESQAPIPEEAIASTSEPEGTGDEETL